MAAFQSDEDPDLPPSLTNSSSLPSDSLVSAPNNNNPPNARYNYFISNPEMLGMIPPPASDSNSSGLPVSGSNIVSSIVSNINGTSPRMQPIPQMAQISPQQPVRLFSADSGMDGIPGLSGEEDNDLAGSMDVSDDNESRGYGGFRRNNNFNNDFDEDDAVDEILDNLRNQDEVKQNDFNDANEDVSDNVMETNEIAEEAVVNDAIAESPEKVTFINSKWMLCVPQAPLLPASPDIYIYGSNLNVANVTLGIKDEEWLELMVSNKGVELFKHDGNKKPKYHSMVFSIHPDEDKKPDFTKWTKTHVAICANTVLAGVLMISRVKAVRTQKTDAVIDEMFLDCMDVVQSAFGISYDINPSLSQSRVDPTQNVLNMMQNKYVLLNVSASDLPPSVSRVLQLASSWDTVAFSENSGFSKISKALRDTLASQYFLSKGALSLVSKSLNSNESMASNPLNRAAGGAPTPSASHASSTRTIRSHANRANDSDPGKQTTSPTNPSLHNNSNWSRTSTFSAVGGLAQPYSPTSLQQQLSSNNNETNANNDMMYDDGDGSIAAEADAQNGDNMVNPSSNAADAMNDTEDKEDIDKELLGTFDSNASSGFATQTEGIISEPAKDEQMLQKYRIRRFPTCVLSRFSNDDQFMIKLLAKGDEQHVGGGKLSIQEQRLALTFHPAILADVWLDVNYNVYALPRYCKYYDEYSQLFEAHSLFTHINMAEHKEFMRALNLCFSSLFMASGSSFYKYLQKLDTLDRAVAESFWIADFEKFKNGSLASFIPPVTNPRITLNDISFEAIFTEMQDIDISRLRAANGVTTMPVGDMLLSPTMILAQVCRLVDTFRRMYGIDAAVSPLLSKLLTKKNNWDLKQPFLWYLQGVIVTAAWKRFKVKYLQLANIYHFCLLCVVSAQVATMMLQSGMDILLDVTTDNIASIIVDAITVPKDAFALPQLQAEAVVILDEFISNATGPMMSSTLRRLPILPWKIWTAIWDPDKVVAAVLTLLQHEGSIGNSLKRISQAQHVEEKRSLQKQLEQGLKSKANQIDVMMGGSRVRVQKDVTAQKEFFTIRNQLGPRMKAIMERELWHQKQNNWSELIITMDGLASKYAIYDGMQPFAILQRFNSTLFKYGAAINIMDCLGIVVLSAIDGLRLKIRDTAKNATMASFLLFFEKNQCNYTMYTTGGREGPVKADMASKQQDEDGKNAVDTDGLKSSASQPSVVQTQRQGNDSDTRTIIRSYDGNGEHLRISVDNSIDLVSPGDNGSRAASVPAPNGRRASTKRKFPDSAKKALLSDDISADWLPLGDLPTWHDKCKDGFIIEVSKDADGNDVESDISGEVYFETGKKPSCDKYIESNMPKGEFWSGPFYCAFPKVTYDTAEEWCGYVAGVIGDYYNEKNFANVTGVPKHRMFKIVVPPQYYSCAVLKVISCKTWKRFTLPMFHKFGVVKERFLVKMDTSHHMCGFIGFFPYKQECVNWESEWTHAMVTEFWPHLHDRCRNYRPSLPPNGRQISPAASREPPKKKQRKLGNGQTTVSKKANGSKGKQKNGKNGGAAKSNENDNGKSKGGKNGGRSTNRSGGGGNSNNSANMAAMANTGMMGYPGFMPFMGGNGMTPALNTFGMMNGFMQPAGMFHGPMNGGNGWNGTNGSNYGGNNGSRGRGRGHTRGRGGSRGRAKNGGRNGGGRGQRSSEDF